MNRIIVICFYYFEQNIVKMLRSTLLGLGYPFRTTVVTDAVLLFFIMTARLLQQ